MGYGIGDLVDSRFKVIGLFSDSGGMGQVLSVKDSFKEFPEPLLLKYCREQEDEYIRRFKREVRLLESFKGNPLVVHVFYSNIDAIPPYFVMPLYSGGDLMNMVPLLANNAEEQERVFLRMVECINLLHSSGVFHRDIKPNNFLIDQERILVSDFGLGMEVSSPTRFTTSGFWGTEGYLPPEFRDDGFKNPDASSDIYMLGKSFYVLLTNSNPSYLINNGLVHPALFQVIEKCCDLYKINRYKNLHELNQALIFAFDIIQNRGGAIGSLNQALFDIEKKLKNGIACKPDEISNFLSKLLLLDEGDKVVICKIISQDFFRLIVEMELSNQVNDLLKAYSIMVHSFNYEWPFSEVIARNMSVLFHSYFLSSNLKAWALELAIDAASAKDRWDAITACEKMINSISDDDLGGHVAAVIQKNKDTFLNKIDKSKCKCSNIRSALSAIAI